MKNKIFNKLFGGAAISGRMRITTTRNGKIIRQSGWHKNLVVSGTDTGRNLIAQRLCSTNTYTLNVSHGEIGTGSTAPANSDTGLETGTVRVATTTATASGNIATLRFYFSDATLANGTYNEFGTFIDGTATLGTGQLFNRALFSPAYTKSTGEDTTVEVEITINSA